MTNILLMLKLPSFGTVMLAHTQRIKVPVHNSVIQYLNLMFT